MELKKWINEEYLTPAKMRQLQRSYKSAKPTPHIALRGLFKEQRIRELKRALRTLEFERKEADLFSFSQTGDLLAAKNPTIRDLVALFSSLEFNEFIDQITDMKTTPGKIDIAGYRYESTDHLLCHDDGFASRRIAYVLNLSTMRPEQGGALAFFNADKKKQPTTFAKRIFPQENTLMLFTVTPTSHHMVEEVISGERLSITGWFHA